MASQVDKYRTRQVQGYSPLHTDLSKALKFLGGLDLIQTQRVPGNLNFPYGARVHTSALCTFLCKMCKIVEFRRV